MKRRAVSTKRVVDLMILPVRILRLELTFSSIESSTSGDGGFFDVASTIPFEAVGQGKSTCQ